MEQWEKHGHPGHWSLMTYCMHLMTQGPMQSFVLKVPEQPEHRVAVVAVVAAQEWQANTTTPRLLPS